MMRFDWYQATFYDDVPPSILFDRIAGDLPGAYRVEHLERGKNGYSKTAILLDREDHTLATMHHGGNAGAPPNIASTGPDAPVFADTVRSLRLSHGVTRGDACQDLEGEDFDRAVDDLRVIARRFGVKGLAWVPDDPESGATYYAGRPQSDIRLRVYRKDLQLIGRGCDPDDFPQPIVRFEAQVRPRKPLRRQFATMEAEQYFGASKLLRAVSTGFLDHHPKAVVMQKREPSTFDSQVNWLRTQAVNVLAAIRARHPSDEQLGRFIREEIIERGLKSC
jgi:DNA relaxase NicK